MTDTEPAEVGLELSGDDDEPEIIYSLTKRIDVRECESAECSSDAVVYVYDRDASRSEFLCGAHAP